MRRWACLLLLVAVPTFAAPAPKPRPADDSDHFMVKTVSGDVLVWGRDIGRWLKVMHGTRLRKGSLIQVGERSSVSLESVKKLGFKGVTSGRTVFSINTPLVMRLDEHSLRSMDMDKRFIVPDATLAGEPDRTDQHETPAKFDLSDAWTRIAAMLTRGGREKSETAIVRSDLTVAIGAKRLELLAPQPDALIYSPGRPVDLRVVWKAAPEERATYLVYLWRVNEDRGPPLAKTVGDYHTVQVRDEGRFFVQVTTADGEWQSSAHLIYVHRKLPSGLSFSEGSASTEPQVRLAFPPNDFIAMAQHDGKLVRSSVRFAWHGRLVGARGVTYELVVMDTTSGSEVFHRKTALDYADLSLPPGDYSWRITASAGEKLHVVSPSRSLEVFARHSQSSVEVLKTLLSTYDSGVFYFPGTVE